MPLRLRNGSDVTGTRSTTGCARCGDRARKRHGKMLRGECASAEKRNRPAREGVRIAVGGGKREISLPWEAGNLPSLQPVPPGLVRPWPDYTGSCMSLQWRRLARPDAHGAPQRGQGVGMRFTPPMRPPDRLARWDEHQEAHRLLICSTVSISLQCGQFID